MPTCKQCSTEFPNWIMYKGKRKNVSNRKFCIKCSPFGGHNTSPFGIKENRKYFCGKCGETDPKKFYGKKRRVCGKCHSFYTTERGRGKKVFACQQLGGKCVICGFDKYIVSLDVHHLNPAKKDKNFKSMRGWSKERILKEIVDCVLMCRNCHAAVHAGLLKYQSVVKSGITSGLGPEDQGFKSLRSDQ